MFKIRLLDVILARTLTFSQITPFSNVFHFWNLVVVYILVTNIDNAWSRWRHLLIRASVFFLKR
ncbi:hypothetical protein Hanom_Chr09g00805551 [Helianthus anomalus]